MINVNKNFVLFFTLLSASWLMHAPAISIPCESVHEDVSLFLLAEDHDGNYVGGFFDVDATQPVNKITLDELQDMNEATLDLEGQEVAISDSYDSLQDDNVIYFEIDNSVKVVRALIVNSFLAAEVFEIVELDFDDDLLDFNFDDDLFGDVEQQKELTAQHQSPVKKHFSPSELYALAKIATLVCYDKMKRLCGKATKQMRSVSQWVDQNLL